MLESFASELMECSVCHDQCLFATTEVFASGRQTFATSRKAMLIDAVRRGAISWSHALVEVVYAGLNSGIQHEVCIHRDRVGGHPDETLYVRAARVEIVRAGCAPDWAVALRDNWKQSRNPYNVPYEPSGLKGAATLFVLDPASLVFLKNSQQRVLALAERLQVDMDVLIGGYTGFELYDLGFADDAKQAAQELHRFLLEAKPQTLVCNSPEAVYMMRHVWKAWNLPVEFDVLHVSEWLARTLKTHLPTFSEIYTYHDPSYLARYLGVVDEPRKVLGQLGVKLAEMLRHGKEALPSGSFYGEAVGTWIKKLALERAASAQAVGASAIITASPFDYRDFLGTMQVYDFVEIAAQKLS